MTTIAIIGGTGPQGKGLGYRFARGGHDIVLGSRDESRASEAAAVLAERLTDLTAGSVSGATNVKACEVADVVLLAVPYDGHDALVARLAEHLGGKIVICCVNPLGFDTNGPYGLDLGPTSAAETAQQVLPASTVVGAFHHLSAVSLISDAEWLDHEDVLVCGDDVEAKQVVIDLAATVTGRPGISVAGMPRSTSH